MSKILKWAATVIIVVAHFFITGNFERWLHGNWPYERLAYELSIGMYLASSLSAFLCGMGIYLIHTVKMPKRKAAIEEEEEEDILPKGPLYDEPTVRQHGLTILKDVMNNYGTYQEELTNALDKDKAREIIYERQRASKPIRPVWS